MGRWSVMDDQTPLEGPPIDQTTQPLPPARHADLVPRPDPFAAPPAAPDITETVDAAFRLNNPIGSLLAHNPLPDATPTPGYNPFDTIRGTSHAGDDLSIYAGSPNEAYTRGIMAQQDSEDKDRRTLAASGWPGTVATIGAGLADPLLYVPIVGDFAAAGVAGKAAILAGQAAVGSAASEAALHATQVGRSWQDSEFNVASATILSGALGAAWGMLSPAEQAVQAKALDAIRPRAMPDGTLAPVEAQPVGAAPTDIRQLELKSTGIGIEKLGTSPNLRILNSPFVEARRIHADMVNLGVQLKPEAQVAPFGPNLENQARTIENSSMARTIDILDDAWKQHYYGEQPPGKIQASLGKEGITAPTTATKLSNHDFDQQVGVAMHNGDTHANPEVQQAARDIRKVWEPVTQMAEETKLQDGRPMLDPNRSAPNGAQSYFPYMWDRDKIKANYNDTRQFFADEMEREQGLKAGIQERISGALASGDKEALADAVSQWKGNAAIKPEEEPGVAAERMIGTKTDLSRQELSSRAQEWVDRLIGSPVGRLDYDAQPASAGFHGGLDELRGSLKDRATWVDVNKLIDRGILNTSAKQGTASMLRAMVPDTLIARRFDGDISMESAFRKVNDEAASMIEKGADSAKIIKQRDGVLADLKSDRDRLRGVAGWDQDPQSRNFAGLIRDFQNLNVMTKLGTSAVVRSTDLTNLVFRYGVATVWKDAWTPLVKSFMSSEFRGIAREQALDAGLGVGGLLGHNRHNFYDVIDATPGNKFSRTLAYGADKSMIANLHTPLTDAAETLAHMVSQGEMGRATKRVVDGVETAKDMDNLMQLQIGRSMAERISRQYEANSTLVDGRKVANTSTWTDRGARDAFNAAMQHDSSMAVMRAGIGDKPLFMDKKFAALLAQFKNFVFAAHEKILISNLQQMDARTLQGFAVTLGMGGLATFLYKEASGQPWPSTPENWLAESIDRSAMTGIIGEANRTLSGATHGQASLDRLYGATGPLSRRANIDLLGQFAGPTGDVLQKTGKSLYDAASGNFGATDVHNIRQQFLPLENMMFLRRGIDRAEEGFDRAMGIPARRPQ